MIRLGTHAVEENDIRVIDMSRLEQLHVIVHMADGRAVVLDDADTVDALMRLCPGVFEGKRLRFVKHAWALHNLVGHPFMQVCSLFGLHGLGMWFHDRTIPRPKGIR
jgi:hypothetical protein